MLLSKGSAQRVETAVKVALGATRRRLALECLVDGLMVSLAGAAVGTLFAWWTTNLVPLLFFVEDADHLVFAPNVVWLGSVAGKIWIAAVTFCALAPLVAAPHREPWLVLKRHASGASRRVTSPSRGRRHQPDCPLRVHGHHRGHHP